MISKIDPSTPSSDYMAMAPYWAMVDAILGGKNALEAAGQTYLPKMPKESLANYQRRLEGSPFTNIYADIVANLASKPFAEGVRLVEGALPRFMSLAEDIDGRGNNLNVFAAQTFYGGINYAIDWIFVDYSRAPHRGDGRPLTIAEEGPSGLNLRPYWVRVPASRVLAVYADIVRGREVIVHARLRENVIRRDGFGEVSV
ncbi:MAG TPA: hypothetical protein VFN88_03565, partial [Caulobacteraceae bacterium]|nr:hypothetical protein [Caulobacteraceae bacterium]